MISLTRVDPAGSFFSDFRAMPIELHSFDTPNGRKISVALEEMALPYTIRIVDITKGQQFDPEFLKISPNGKIPAIVDRKDRAAVR